MKNLNDVYENIISESWINKGSENFYRGIYDILRDDELSAKKLLKPEIYDALTYADSGDEFIERLQRDGFLTKTDNEIEREIHSQGE